MANLKLAEPILDAVVAKLQAGVGARIAAINALDTRGIIVKTPENGDYYVGGAGGGIPRAPAIIVTDSPSDGEAEAEGPHSFIWQGEISVFVVDEDTDRQVLGRKLMRLARAAAETLWDDNPKEALAGSAYHLAFVREEPGPVAQPEDETQYWRSWRYVTFRCWQLEN